MEPDVGALARAIERRGLAATALLLLDAHRPYRPLVAHAATFLAPVLRPLVGGPFASARDLLSSEENIDRLVASLESGRAEGRADA
ncbi:MAG: hypothetical protein ABR509_08515 [Candidatus Limnocylindria bacterium]